MLIYLAQVNLARCSKQKNQRNSAGFYLSVLEESSSFAEGQPERFENEK